MIDLKSKLCNHIDGCNTQPVFGKRGDRATRCFEHKDNDMINIMARICNYEYGCDIQSNFGYKGKIAIRCSIHKDDDMVDVHTKQCQKCDSTAEYGTYQKSILYCEKHKLPNMVKNPNRKCLIINCKNSAIYGLSIHERCENHKEHDDKNFIEDDCKSCGLAYPLDPDGYCLNCSPVIFEKSRLVKQTKVKNWLDSSKFNYTSYDKIITETNCGRKRPDFVFNSKDRRHLIVLEVDENQHKSYPEECECIRMINLTNEVWGNIMYIRYKPR